MSPQKNLIAIVSFVRAIQCFPKKFVFFVKFITFKLSPKSNFLDGSFSQEEKEKKRIMNFFKKRCLLFKRLLTHCKIFRDTLLEIDLEQVQIKISKINHKILYYSPLVLIDQKKNKGLFMSLKNYRCAKPSLP